MSNEQRGGITRREFAKASAAAGFAILTAKSGIAATNSDTLRIGLIGCGGRGAGAVLNCLQGNDNVKIVALADMFADRLQSKRKEMENHKSPRIKPKVDINDDMCFTGLDAYKKLLETDVEMIIHATPPYARPMHITAAVAAGKHIFVEKPVAVDPVGVRMFIEAANKAKEKGLSFVTGTQRRHQDAYIETIQKIHDGEIGELLSARAYWNGNLPFCHERNPEWSDLEYRLRNWYNYIWVCGDNIVEQHIHNLDVINWAMNAHPVKVTASGGRAWKPLEEKYGDLWDNFSCDFEYPSGAHMYSFSRHWNDSANAVFEEVTGTKGKSNCRDKGKDSGDPMVQEHVDLVNSIRGTGPYLNTGVVTAESTMTAIMGRMAAYTGKELTWDEALNSELSLVPEDLSFDKAYPVGPIPVPGT